MKITILHWMGTCPHCNTHSRLFANFNRDEDRVKLQQGFECDNCNQIISNEEFDGIIDLVDSTTTGEFRVPTENRSDENEARIETERNQE